MRNLFAFLYTCLLLASASSLFAQVEPSSSEGKLLAEPERKGLVYNKEWSLGGGINTNGWHLNFTTGRLRNYYFTRTYTFEFVEITHPKERRDNNPYSSAGSKPFIYGKQNSFFVLRAGLFGGKRYLTDKAKKKGIAVGYNYSVGPCLGLLKPYYLDMRVGSENDIRAVRYDENNPDQFLLNFNIVGPSSFGVGLGELSPLVGGFGKIGVLFDWGAFDEMVKDLEIGLAADIFYKKVPIMVTEQNTGIFLNLYVALHLGKRR